MESDGKAAQDEVGRTELSRCERWLVGCLLAVTFLLRLLLVFLYRFDSDEPQHLHVVWGWVHGLVQYRDVFDNHMPFFHWLSIPIYLLLGERPQLLFAMRLAMVPLYALMLWAVYRLGRILVSPRVGAWAAALAGLFPLLFLCSVEYRSDDPWTTIWTWALVVLVSGRWTLRRSFVAGLLLSLAMAISLKTILLLIALAAAAGMTVALTGPPSGAALRKGIAYAGVTLLTSFVLPIAIGAGFALHGLWEPFWYGVVGHNLFSHRSIIRILLFPASLPVFWWCAERIRQRTADTGVGVHRIFVFLAGGLYFAALNTFWPLLSLESYLPFYPVFMILVAVWLLGRPTSTGDVVGSLDRLPGWRPLAFAGVEIVAILAAGMPWHNAAQEEIDLLSDVLKITKPGDLVIDLKGETVFRQRPFYYLLETISQLKLSEGLLKDEIPESLIATRTCVATPDDSEFPPRAQSFMRQNYIPAGHLKVAGKILPPESGESNAMVAFTVEIPADYMIVSREGIVHGELDGSPMDGARFLGAGRHTFRPSGSLSPEAALVWAPAIEHGLSPFGTDSGLSADEGKRPATIKHALASSK